MDMNEDTNCISRDLLVSDPSAREHVLDDTISVSSRSKKVE